MSNLKSDIQKDGSKLIVALEGRLDTNTSQELETKLDSLKEVDSIEFDFEKLEYISSAGLRILLACSKEMQAKNGSLIIKHVNEEINSIFEVTGFSDILVVEN